MLTAKQRVRRRAWKVAHRAQTNARERARYAKWTPKQRAEKREKERLAYWARRRKKRLSPAGRKAALAQALARAIRKAGRPPPEKCETCGKKVRRSEERRVGKECRSRWSPY